MGCNNIAKWQREFKSFMGIKSGIILEGNILDLYLYEDEKNVFLPLDQLLQQYGNDSNSEVIFYNPLQGFYCFGNEEEQMLSPYLEGYISKKEYGPYGYDAYMPVSNETEKNAADMSDKINLIDNNSGCNEANDRYYDAFKQVNMSKIVLRGMLNKERRYKDGELVQANQYPSKIFVLNFASRLVNCNLDETAQTEMFMNLYQAINNSKAMMPTGKKNMLVFVVDKYNDLPAWIYFNNPYIRTFFIEKPDRKTRRLFLETAVRRYSEYEMLNKVESELSERFVAETDELMCTEIQQLINLAANEKIPVENIKTAIKMYKYGIQESPWQELESDILQRLNNNLQERVIGQDSALDKVKKVVMRSVKGISGLQHSNADNKPRGIMFFAGPTGVGKTETAKTIAATIFGDEEACIRFDMSEYREAHSDQKLFGAPPGYVGYEGGGQLTNAIKNHPFSVLLFDEIEKADPTILDKFLQILEDGRMTDNQGNTVYFSESIIIFTSNIGLTEEVIDISGERRRRPTIVIENPNEDDTEDFKKLTVKTITEGVKNYFINIGRPELLNRLGENNIIVFNFIDKSVAMDICNHQVNKIVKDIKQRINITIETKGIQKYLNNIAISRRQNGGRGIGNMLEEILINPLSEYLCRCDKNITRIICSIDSDNNIIFKGE